MPNIWKQFNNLLPKQKQIIGKVVSTNTSNITSTIELLSGNGLVVKGIGDIGSFYLIKDGIITEKMPTLGVYNETVY